MAQPELIQPVENQRGVQLLVDERTAWVTEEGDRASRLRLRAGDLMIAIAELDDGWIATGMRPADQGYDLFLAWKRNGRVRRLTGPRGVEAPLAVRPVPLVANQRLEGLAWLEGEGPRGFAVRAAAWNGAGWGQPETVAEPGPGSQTGLTGAVLADGSWLLAWSAWDGRDDEILYATRRDGSWTRARRLHPNNRVPDVTPSLIAVEGGALAAWSRLETDEYRVTVARFDGSDWSAPQAGAGAGTLLPGFVRFAGDPLMLYREARGGTWAVAEISASGQARRRATSVVASAARPAVEQAGPDRIRLRTADRGEPGAVRWEEKR